MLRTKQTAILLSALIVILASTQVVHAWSYLAGTLNSPFNQCKTCHISNSNLTLNPYGDDYLDPSHASKYASKHSGDMGDCNNCHNGKNYPILRSGLDNIDSDLDLFTNLEEFNGGTFPGDATDFPLDGNAPMITAFSMPASSNSLTVAITSFSATDDVAVSGYMLTETNSAPAAGNSAWSASAPTQYSFATADIYTLYAWAKDAAGNVSASMSAQVDTTPSATRVNEPPVAAAGADQTLLEGDTVTLNANASTDDVFIITYAWVQLDGPGGNALSTGDPLYVSLSDNGALAPTFVTPVVGMSGATLTLQLTVTDGDNATSSDEIDVTVNDNGISDFDAMPDVISTNTSSGDPIGISAESTNACTKLSTMNIQDLPASTNQPSDMLYGVVDFELQVNDPANCSITIHLAAPAPADYKWYKYTSARGWFDFDRELISNGTGEGAVFNADRTAVTIYIDDNSEFDDNPEAGLIRDPGGLGSGTSPSTAINVGSNTFGGGGASGGGCFISTAIGR